MPTYIYEALDTRGRMIQGQMDATNMDSVIEELRAFRCTVTNIKPKKDYLSTLKEFCIRLQKVDVYALAIFTRQFSTIYNAGLPIVKGLEGLAAHSINKRLGLIIQEVHDDVKGGFSLTRALQKHSKIFSSVYIAMIRAGEMAGALGEILDRLANFLEKDYKLRKKVQTSMIYPIFVFIVAVIIIFFLVNYIFPTFANLFEGLDIEMPWPTRFLILTSNIGKNPFVILFSVLSIFITVYLFKLYFATPLGRRQVDQLLIELPVIGRVNKKVAVSRFCRTLGTLIESGVPMIHALDVVGKVSGNEVISDIVDEIKMSLKGGMKLSQPLKAYKIFPGMVAQMVAVGEETGNLPGTLNKLATFYDAEVEMALDAFIALLEPIMIFVMGGIVVFVLLAVFLPVYAILQKF